MKKLPDTLASSIFYVLVFALAVAAVSLSMVFAVLVLSAFAMWDVSMLYNSIALVSYRFIGALGFIFGLSFGTFMEINSIKNGR